MPSLPFEHLQVVPWEAAPLALPPAFSPATHTLYKVISPQGDTGLFTGYYEPELAGSYERTDLYRYPVYCAPADPTRFSRADIHAGALKGEGLELLYCADKIALFFMHIQGSGCIRLPGGTVQRVRFAAKNQRSYTPIGRVLKERGALPPITMQSITAWLRAHPDQQDAILCANESFIFFARNDALGPIGAAGHVLEAETSLAVDELIWPYGLNMIVETTHPVTHAPFVRLMRTADTGSAIKGIIRGDIFFGSGGNAAEIAGRMQQQGRMWLLLKK